MVKRLVLVVGAVMLGWMASGCATIVTGTTQDVSFQSEPDGATVLLGERALGKTPVTVTIKKESGQKFSFEKTGYRKKEMRLNTGMNPWFFGNILIGGLLGSSTDGLSGAALEYVPNHYFVTLEPDGQQPTDQAAQKRTMVKKYVVQSYLAIMQDMAQGGGEYFTTLLDLLSIPREEAGEALEKVRALSEEYKDAPVFADRVMEVYNVQ